MAWYNGWRKGAAIVFIIFSLLNLAVSLERMVFDVFGQMWGTMLINGMTVLCTITGLLGVCIRERIAITVYLVWGIISIGLNIVVVFVYNDVGLLSEKEHYLGLVVGNDNWWRTNGINCRPATTNTTTISISEGSGEGAGEPEVEGCLLSYALTETIHASIYMLLTILTLFLSLPLLCYRDKKVNIGLPNDDGDEFSYVSIAQWHDYRRQGSRQGTHQRNYFGRWSSSLNKNAV